MKIYNKQKNIVTIMLSSMVLFTFLVSPAHAFFGEQESSQANSFGASSLGIALAVIGVTSDSRHIEVSADYEEDIEYTIANTSVTGAFCSDVRLVIERDAVELYNDELANFTETIATSLLAGDTNDISLAFSVADENSAYTGDCAITFSYRANQAGYMYGEAFFDTETDTVILTGSSFGTPAPVSAMLHNTFLSPEGKNNTNNEPSDNQQDDGNQTQGDGTGSNFEDETHVEASVPESSEETDGEENNDEKGDDTNDVSKSEDNADSDAAAEGGGKPDTSDGDDSQNTEGTQPPKQIPEDNPAEQ